MKLLALPLLFGVTFMIGLTPSPIIASPPVAATAGAARLITSRPSSSALRRSLEDLVTSSAGTDSNAAIGLAKLLVAGDGGPADPARAEALLRSAFAQGSIAAGAELGDLLLGEIGRNTDAAQVLQSAFRQGSGRAGLLLADVTTIADPASAVVIESIAETMLRAAALTGDGEAATTLADHLRKLGTPGGLADARKLYATATTAGSPSAPYWSAAIDEQVGGPTPTTEQLYDLSARRGYLAAARELAGRPGSDPSGLHAYWRDAMLNANDPIAQLDQLRTPGIEPTQRDLLAAEAIQQLQQDPSSTSADLIEAAGRFAVGDGVGRDPRRAASLLLVASERGNVDAASALVELIENDVLGDDVVDGHHLYALVSGLSDAGWRKATLALGDMRLRGIGVEPDPAGSAAAFLKVASDGVSGSAMFKLGEAYLLSADARAQEKAVNWLISAGLHGSSSASLMVARLLGAEPGVASDMGSPADWYARALEDGQVSAATPIALSLLATGHDGAQQKAEQVFTSRLPGPLGAPLWIAYANYLDLNGGPDRAETILSGADLAKDPAALLALYFVRKRAGAAPAALSDLLHRALASAAPDSKIRVSVARELLVSAIASDASLGLKQIEDAFATGAPTGAVAFAELYANGTGVAKDVSRALQILEQGAARKEADAIVALADMLQSPDLPTPDPERAGDLYKLALRADPFDADANFGIGTLLSTGRLGAFDYPAAALHFRVAALQGHAGAQLALGALYQWGNGVERNAPRAEAWFHMASLAGSTAAASGLASFYSSGIATAPKPDPAFESIMTAAKDGDSVAMIQLGQDYLEGYGTAIDPVSGVKWLERSADQGSTDAMLFLYQAYSLGDGVAEDTGLAEHWLQRAAGAGSDRAMYRIAIRSRNPDGTITDPTALALLQRAALLDNNQSKKMLKKMGLPLPALAEDDDVE